MVKNLVSGPILARLAEICAPNFFRGFYLYWMLDILTNYHHIQFQGKCMIQTQENEEKSYFGPDLGPLDPNSGRQFFF